MNPLDNATVLGTCTSGNTYYCPDALHGVWQDCVEVFVELPDGTTDSIMLGLALAETLKRGVQ